MHSPYQAITVVHTLIRHVCVCTLSQSHCQRRAKVNLWGREREIDSEGSKRGETHFHIAGHFHYKNKICGGYWTWRCRRWHRCQHWRHQLTLPAIRRAYTAWGGKSENEIKEFRFVKYLEKERKKKRKEKAKQKEINCKRVKNCRQILLEGQSRAVGVTYTYRGKCIHTV